MLEKYNDNMVVIPKSRIDIPLRALHVQPMTCRQTFPQRLVMEGLMLDKKDDTMRVQIVEEMCLMVNYSLCVCGSGKSHVDCCPNIAHGSVLAELLTKYRYVDQLIEEQRKEQGVAFCCKKGCSDCCRDYFYISMMEYFLIRNELVRQQSFFVAQNQAKRFVTHLNQVAPQEIAKWDEPTPTLGRLFDDHANVLRCPPCPVLDNAGACSVYAVRPLICRLYGVSNMFSVCSNIHHQCKSIFGDKVSERKLQKHLIKLELDAVTLHENVDWFSNNGMPHYLKPYPLMYWLANDELYFGAFVAASSKSPSEFSKHLSQCKG